MKEFVERGSQQEVTVLPIVLHGRLVKLLTEAGAKRGKSVPQLISDAILEKAEVMYQEDFPKTSGG